MCLAVPVREYRGQTVAAIRMAVPIERMAPDEEYYGRSISAAAGEISLSLGYVPRPIPEPAAP